MGIYVYLSRLSYAVHWYSCRSGRRDFGIENENVVEGDGCWVRGRRFISRIWVGDLGLRDNSNVVYI